MKNKKWFIVAAFAFCFNFLVLSYQSAFAADTNVVTGKTATQNYNSSLNTDYNNIIMNRMTDADTTTYNTIGTPSGGGTSYAAFNVAVSTISSFTVNFKASDDSNTSSVGLDLLDANGVKIGTTKWLGGFAANTQVTLSATYTTPVTGVHYARLVFSNPNSGAHTFTVYDVQVMGSSADSTPPGNVGSLQAVNGINRVDLSWNNPLDSDLANIKIYRDSILLATLMTSETSYSDTTGVAGTPYTYKVTTIDTTGNESSGVTVVGTSQTQDTTAPAEVTNIQQTITSNSVNFTFDNPLDSDFSKVNIYKDSVLHGFTTNGTYSISGLTPETSYSFQFKSVDASGNESVGTVKTITTLPEADTTAPNVPNGVNITVGNSSLMVTWDANTEIDLQGYNVYVDGIKHNATPLTNTSYILEGLNNDQVYSITVSAIDNDNNESAQTLAVTGTPSNSAMPLLHLDYSLQDVADGTANWFGTLWLVVAFASAIPLAFYVGNRTKLLFLD